MAVAVIKRTGESNEKVIGRWKKKTRQARIVQESKDRKAFKRTDSLTKEKKSAIVREKYRTKRRKESHYG